MDFVYPATDYDRPRALLAALGSFWAEVYQGDVQLDAIMAAKGSVENQTVTDLLTAAAAISRDTAPIYRTDNWSLLRLLKSQREATFPPAFDGSVRHDAGSRHDVPRSAPTFSFPAPPDLAEAPLLLNRFAEPTLAWASGQEFLLRDGRFVFLTDPFADVRVAKRPVYADGVVTDEEAALWVFRGQYDHDDIFRQFGYVVGMRLPSSAAYRELLNAFFDALVCGVSRRHVERAFAAMTGAPLAKEQRETVVDVSEDPQGRLIVTDQHVYRFPTTTTAIVQVGDVVTAGQSLTDALEFIELNRGETPASLRALSVGSGFLAACYGELVFENRDVPLEVVEAAEHPSGFTFVRFGLGGLPADVEQFFAEVHERGVAASQLPVDECDLGKTITFPGDECSGLPDRTIRAGTLAHLLDRRTIRRGEPSAAALPRTINPLQFLVSYVLRANAAIVRIRPAGLRGGVGMHVWPWFRRIAPPHTAIIVAYELAPPPETFGDAQFGESLSGFVGMEPQTDTVVGVGDSPPSIRVVAGTCQ